MADNVLEEERRRKRAEEKAKIQAQPDARPLEEQIAAGFAQPESAAQVEEFGQLEEPVTYSKGGRDYYTNADGKLVSVLAGSDALSEYPDLQPATAEQVAEHELQKRKGSGWDQLNAAVETGLRTVAGAESLASRIGTFNPASIVNPNIPENWTPPLEPDQIAPELYTRDSMETARANPKSALAGALAADLATAMAMPSGGGGVGAAGRVLQAGLLGAGSDAAMTGEAPRVSDVAQYALLAGTLEALSGVQWGEAMRSLGKKGRSAIDGAVENAQTASVAETLAEKNPLRRALLLRNNAEAIYQQAQLALDENLAKLDERIVAAPERMFTRGVLKKSVSSNVTAQAEQYAAIATKLSQAAHVTEIPALQEAAELVGRELGSNGPTMFATLREAAKKLRGGVDELIADTPLTREALDAIDNTLVDEGVWGRAAKNHAQFARPLESNTPAVLAHELGTNVAAREALEARLSAARTVASATGDKQLAKAVAGIEKAIAQSDLVTGARLLGTVRTAVGDVLKNKGVRMVGDQIGKIGGAVIGGAIGGPFGMAAGTVAGSVMGDLAAPYVRRAVDRVTSLKIGNAWTRRLYKEAKAAAKKNPVTTAAGAALLGAGAAQALSGGDGQDSGEAPVAAASAGLVGLLAALLPKGGRRVLSEELGRALSGLTARERLHVRMATERTAGDVEHFLRRFAAGDRNMTHAAFGPEQVLAEGSTSAPRRGSTRAMESTQDLLNGQFTIQLQEYEKRAGVAAEAVSPAVREALEADVRTRNAAIIENDQALKRLARVRQFDVLPKPAENWRGSVENWPGMAERDRAHDALEAGDMPMQARNYLDVMGSELATALRNVDATDAAAVKDAVYHQLGKFNREFARSHNAGRPMNPRERAYAEAFLRDKAEFVTHGERQRGAGQMRDTLETVAGGSVEERLRRALDLANRNAPTTSEIPAGAGRALLQSKDRLRETIVGRGIGLRPQDLEYEVQGALATWLRRVDADFGYSFAERKPQALALAEAELRWVAHHAQATRPRPFVAPPAAPAPSTLTERVTSQVSSRRDYLLEMGAAAQRGDAPARQILEEQLHGYGYFGEWKRMAESALGRELTEAEAAWGREGISGYARELLGIESGSTRDRALERGLRVKEGEAQPVQGSPEFRRLGLDEPTQGEVRIEKAPPDSGAASERGPLRIEGDYQNPQAVRDARRQRREAGMRDVQESDLPEGSMLRLQESQELLRDHGSTRVRTWSDEGIARMAQVWAERWAREAGAGASAIEYARGRFEGQMHAMRTAEYAREPLSFAERAELAFDAIHGDDMPERMQSHLLDLQRNIIKGIEAETKPEEIARRVRELSENFADTFVVKERRKPNRRERAYAEATLLERAESSRQYELREQAVRKARVEREARETQEREVQRARAAERRAREAQRIEDLMGALDLPEEHQEAIARRYDQTIGDLLEAKGQPRSLSGEARREAGVGNFDVIDALRAQPDGLSEAEEVFVLDQLGEPPVPALQWLRHAVDERIRMDDSMDPTDATDLDFDDLQNDIARSEQALDPWLEYHLRHTWDEVGSDLEQRYSNALDEARQERKDAHREEHGYDDESPDSDAEPDSYNYRGGSRSSGRPDLDFPDDHSVYITGDGSAEGRVFRQRLSEDDWRQLLALDEIQEMADELGVDFDMKLDLSGDSIKFTADGHGLDLRRDYKRTDKGFSIYHDHLFLPDNIQGQKTGMKLLRSMFTAYERLGGTQVRLSAADVGKYVWPMLGFRPSPESMREALREFFHGSFMPTWDVRLSREAEQELEKSTTDLRDLSGVTVPLSALKGDLASMENHYMERMRDALPFGETFIRGKGPDAEFKLGKYFLLTKHGSWNSGLKIDIDKADPWYQEFIRRIGMAGLSALGLQELLRAFGSTDHEVDTTEEGAVHAAVMSTPDSEIESAAKQQTRGKLAYLRAQSENLVRSTGRELAGPRSDRIVPVRPGLTQSAGVGAFAGPHENLRAAYEEKRATLERLQKDPLQLVDEMSDRLADMADADPDLHGNVVAKTYEVLRYLQDKLPGTIGASLTRPKGTPPTDTALRQFALYYSAATNPGTVLQDLANNRARKEQVDALRQLWPDKYQELKLAVLSELAEHRPSLGQRTRLELLFDFGGALDGALSKRVVDARAAYQAEQLHKQPQGGAMPDRRTQPSIVGTSPTARLSYGAAALPA